MRRLILVFMLGTLASSLAEANSCREIDGGMECASLGENSASYTKAISRTGQSARMNPLPPLKPLRPLFPPMRPSYIQPLGSSEYFPLPQQPVRALPGYFQPQPELPLFFRRKRSVGNVLLPYQPKGDLLPYQPAVPSPYRRKRSPAVGHMSMPMASASASALAQR